MRERRVKLRFICLAVAAGLAQRSAAAGPPSRTPSPPPATAAPSPCLAPEYRQFDFWLGDWDVAGPDGKPAGRNRIASVAGGCAVEEKWTSARGGQSASLSAYDASSKRWHQTVVDDSGGWLQLDGEFRDGKMILVGRHHKSRGTTIVHRIVWTPADSDHVHQLWEASPNEGRSWQTVFEGSYTKRR